MEEIGEVKALGSINSFIKTDSHFLIKYETGEEAKLNILNSHVFKYYMSPTGEFLDYPVPNNPEDVAKITVKDVSDYDVQVFEQSTLENHDKSYIVHTEKISIRFDKEKATMHVYDKRHKKEVFKESQSLTYAKRKTTQVLHQHTGEHFFGGGMQNGRFTHKGEIIEIVNTNNWTDGGVSSPCPFYWSSYGYGVLRNTWRPGYYDFGKESSHLIKTFHEEKLFDAFYFINSEPKDILNDYYELTGQPTFMPEYAFYEAHLNAFNRDYWVEVTPDTPLAILFEDGKYYRCYQPSQLGDKVGILESLNGEKNNYQFSARAMIDRYQRHDLPLGWFIPNDGYGSGYGQTDSLDGDIENLKQFGDYSRKNGVEVSLWTESNLEPCDPEHPKKGERDLRKEVSVAGVVALKCDVAWIGSGYSFAFNAVENAANIFRNATKNNVRTMIIMVDGWAGIQRHSGIWSGDQSGGEWEYIRFHIPTYIGAGLSGLPLIGSDMDGIFGGGDKEVNIRDYQWKAFTPLQLNMDGWGRVQKTPFAFDEETTAINRAYLKFKSLLMPYNYTIGHESIHGLPMVRAIFLEFPKETVAYTKDCQYQYMWGPSILVAPVYSKEYLNDELVRNAIYLPDRKQLWIDILTGDKYQGGKFFNNMKTPIWKIPIFVKDGAVIPFGNFNNNPYEIKRYIRTFNLYPSGETSFEVYEDDGISSDYLEQNFATTKIVTVGPASNEHGDLYIGINKTQGSYKEMVKDRITLIQIVASKDIDQVKAAINGKSIYISKVQTEEEFNKGDNVCYFKENFVLNPYLNEFGKAALQQKYLLLKIQKVDVTENEIQIKLKGYANKSKIFGRNSSLNGSLNTPAEFTVDDEKVTPTSITVQWEPVEEALYYEIERDGAIFTNIVGTTSAFDNFMYESEHVFKVRSVNDEGVSEWSDAVTAITKEDPYKNTVKGVKVSCNMPCQPCQEICKLTDGNLRSLWHTHWGEQGQCNPKNNLFLKIKFDLGNIHELEKIVYIPRDDAGNGTFLKLQYRFSNNGTDWSRMSDEIVWVHDSSEKTIPLNEAKLRYMELNIIDSVGGFGSGRQVLFYKKVK